MCQAGCGTCSALCKQRTMDTETMDTETTDTETTDIKTTDSVLLVPLTLPLSPSPSVCLCVCSMAIIPSHTRWMELKSTPTENTRKQLQKK